MYAELTFIPDARDRRRLASARPVRIASGRTETGKQSQRTANPELSNVEDSGPTLLLTFTPNDTDLSRHVLPKEIRVEQGR